jgi:recombination protein RecA
MNREEALDVALGQIERQFGKGSVMRMSDAAQVSVGAVSTGSLSLDLALGIGGLPRGRVVEIFGPESSGKTTLVYHVIAEAQRRGGICAFIDAEHAMDPAYARRIGVNIDDLLVSQPDTGEQALEICELLIRSGAVDVVAVDSVAALTPKAEIEGEMGDSHVGLQARLMSQALRKLAGTLNRTDTIAIFTNQLREKIGVMFGCFHYDTRVVLEDGSTEKIGKIVNQRLPVHVLSMDPSNGEIEPRRIVSYFDNGPTDEFWQFEVEAAGTSGRREFACTPNHIVFTPAGEREAGELEVGDAVLVAVEDFALTDDQRQLVYGGVLADDESFSSSYARGGDGTSEIGAPALDREPRELVRSGDRTRLLHERIAPYVHPSMRLTLHPPDASVLTGRRLALRAVPMRITKKYRKPAGRETHRFDLEIEGNHTYLADYVVVHNSPETTPGGRALKFYSSVRLDIRRIETLKDGAEAIGNRVRVKVVKNKVAPPFKQAEFDIIYGSGISWEGSVLDVGLEHKIVTKSGSYFSLGDERLGQGRHNATAFLTENPDLVQSILSRIQLGAGPEQVVSARLLPQLQAGQLQAGQVEPGQLEPAAGSVPLLDEPEAREPEVASAGAEA